MHIRCLADVSGVVRCGAVRWDLIPRLKREAVLGGRSLIVVVLGRGPNVRVVTSGAIC